ncbi:hypothetical protein [Ferrimonas kyonanensis]|uniref:hypothetical protein n=1 Tax=Ferrimonas kyonanensis TaxID=364763 RepID=UPI000405D703|nr:hypothetical protein [Ferrimonas kyonanensis]
MTIVRAKGFIDFVEDELLSGTWIPLYKNLNAEDKSIDGSLYSSLAPKDDRSYMSCCGWDLLLGDGSPSIVTCGDKVWYEQHTSKYIPLVYCRTNFIGNRPRYFEVSQELVLYLRLYHDLKNSKYILPDINGNEIEVIRYCDNSLEIRKSFLDAFLSAKQMDFLSYFECTFHHNEDLTSSSKIENDLLRYDCFSSNTSYVDGYDNITRVLGKKLMLCESLTEENTSPTALEEAYEEFVVGGDSHEPVLHTCNPRELNDYFGANPDAPHFLTPIFFSRDVMQRYYNSPSEYEVSDGAIYKKGYWHLKIDNNHSDFICVFLGDLGRDIPNSEQKYWRCFNIGVEGGDISQTNFKRSVLGQFADPESLDLLFKYRFESFQKAWFENFGWYLFLPLAPSDSHCFDSLHRLTKNETKEFDNQILNLVKITIDSINVKSIKSIITTESSGSIKILNEFLVSQGSELDISPLLGGVQGLRSSGVAHRRGSKYEGQINRLGIDEDDLIAAFDDILSKFISLLEGLKGVLED